MDKKYEVLVQLKKEVLDPEARAIKETLLRLGHNELKGVNVAKRYVLTIDEKMNDPASFVETIARDYLANPVAQTFEVNKLDNNN